MNFRRQLRISTRMRIALGIVVAAITVPGAHGGAPLKGVDVKLGRNPGGQIASRATDSDGKVTFGVLPKGAYSITVSLPRVAASESAPGTALRQTAPPDADSNLWTVTVEGAAAGAIKREWNAQTNRFVESTHAASARMRGAESVIFESDGVHPIGVAVVKAKSNISNN